MTDKKKPDTPDHRINLRGFAPLTKTEQKATLNDAAGLHVAEIDGRRWGCDTYVIAEAECWRQLMHQAVATIEPGRYVGAPLALDPTGDVAPIEKLLREHPPEKMTEPVPAIEVEGRPAIIFVDGAKKRSEERPTLLVRRQAGVVGIDVRRLSVLAGYTTDRQRLTDCHLEGLEVFELPGATTELSPLTVRRGDQLLGIIMPVRLSK